MSYHRFSILQGRAVTDKRVSNSQLRVLAALGMYADKDGWCYPSQSTIGNDLGKSRQTVNGDIAALNELGYIEKHVTKTGKGEEVQVKYRLLYDTLDGGDVESPRQPLSSLPDSNDPSNDPVYMGTDVPEEYPIEWQIAADKPVTSLPKDNEMLKVSEVIAKSFKDDKQLAIDILMAFQKTRGITFDYVDQKMHRSALAYLIKAGVKPQHVVAAVKKLLAKNYECVNLHSIKKTAVGLANPAPTTGPKKLEGGYISPKPGL